MGNPTHTPAQMCQGFRKVKHHAGLNLICAITLSYRSLKEKNVLSVSSSQLLTILTLCQRYKADLSNSAKALPASVIVRLACKLLHGAIMHTISGSLGGQHASNSFLMTAAAAPGLLINPKVRQLFGIWT